MNYNADYDVKAYAEEGSQKLYQGPGTRNTEKYLDVRDIENGETLHITQDAELVDGSYWGVTTVDGNRRLDGSGEDRRMAERNIRKRRQKALMLKRQQKMQSAQSLSRIQEWQQLRKQRKNQRQQPHRKRPRHRK